MKKDWLKNPDVCAKVTAALLLVALFLGIHFFADDFFNKTFTLAISGNVNGLVEYLRSFGSWAILISFVLDVLINAASVFPSIFLSTANGLIFGLPLGMQEYVLIVFVSVIGSAATAGLTGATVMLTLTLSTLGLPLAGVGLLLAIDPILDMGRTAVNVAGQALVPTLVAKRQALLDQAQYDRAGDIEAIDATPRAA